MITTPTVLILGAGASTHVGYPLGRALINQLCGLRGSDKLNNLPSSWSRDEAEQCLTQLSRSGHYSIDAFLEDFPDLAPLGKYLIADNLKSRESIDRLFPPNDPGWYQYLFNGLLGDDGSPAFGESCLSIITFNYDRSLEAYLHEALQARFALDSEQSADILADLPIVHVHGILGEYPAVPYHEECQPDDLVQISSNIQIIHEIDDAPEDFCNPMFARAHDLLVDAGKIFFLGFGFHPDNVRRFRFFTEENTEGKEIHGTFAGMGTVDQRRLIGRLAEEGLRVTPDGHQCNQFFTHGVPLY